MEIEKIKALADILNEKGLSSLELEEGDSRLKIEKDKYFSLKEPEKNVKTETVILSGTEAKENFPKEEPEIENAMNYNNLKEIKSPMVGVFYSAPSPDSAPFVKVGDKIKKGDVLCVIESMKLMNDIVSDIDGEIIDICVNNEDVVEYSQTLFKIL